MKKLILLAASLAAAFCASAQPSEGGRGQDNGDPGMGPMPTVEQEAQTRVDQMRAEMTLSDKQVKQLTKFYKKDIKFRRENLQQGGMPPRPDGENGSGNRPQRPQGGRPAGGMGPGGGPGMGMGPGGGQGGPGMGPGGMPGGQGFGPQSGSRTYGPEDIEKYNQKQDKKLRKIIGDSNFESWRAKHPQEDMPMPQPEIN